MFSLWNTFPAFIYTTRLIRPLYVYRIKQRSIRRLFILKRSIVHNKIKQLENEEHLRFEIVLHFSLRVYRKMRWVHGS